MKPAISINIISSSHSQRKKEFSWGSQLSSATILSFCNFRSNCSANIFDVIRSTCCGLFDISAMLQQSSFKNIWMQTTWVKSNFTFSVAHYYFNQCEEFSWVFLCVITLLNSFMAFAILLHYYSVLSWAAPMQEEEVIIITLLSLVWQLTNMSLTRFCCSTRRRWCLEGSETCAEIISILGWKQFFLISSVLCAL